MKKEKATEAANPLPYTNGKDNDNSRIKATVAALFSADYKMTAKDINRRTGSNDARKVISDLRRQGMNIVDIRLPSGCKLYWLADDNRQLSLFDDDSGVCKTQRVDEVINEMGAGL